MSESFECRGEVQSTVSEEPIEENRTGAKENLDEVKAPYTVLRGEAAEFYVEMLRRLVRGARLNRFYPSPHRLGNLFYLMAPSVNQNLVDSIRVNLLTGLPTESEIGRVIADREICERFLAKQDFAGLEKRTDEASKRLFRRVLYYREVARREVPLRTSLELKLRRVDEVNKRAYFLAIWERFDPGEGLFVRYTIDLIHSHSRWCRPQVELRGEDLKYTEAFRNVISRYSSDEAEFAFVLLSDLPNIEVLEVVRCRVGPLWMDGVRMPEAVSELLRKYPGNLILGAPLERVSPSVKEDKNLDPFAVFYRESLSEDARRLAEARAAQLGYKVYKERKFCCTREIVEPFRNLLQERGFRCVVYAI